MRKLKGFFIMLAVAGRIAAQNGQHTLSTKQAETLALNAPPTLHAAQGKCCADAQSWRVSAGPGIAPYTSIAVQVRCGCGEYAGQLIDNYMVNPATGKIWEGLEESGTALHSKRLDALKKQMLGSK
jgi:hypothetical protein